MNNTRFSKIIRALLDDMNGCGHSNEANHLDNRILKVSREGYEPDIEFQMEDMFNYDIPNEIIEDLLALLQEYYSSLEYLQHLTSGVRAYFGALIHMSVESYASEQLQEERRKAVRSKTKVEEVEVKDLVEEALQRIPEGHHLWYEKSLEYIKNILGVSEGSEELSLFLKVLAATSNNASPKGNFSLAIKALRQHTGGDDLAGFYPVVIENLKRAFSGEELSGPKVREFYKNLLGDQEAVTIDKHMWQIIFGKDRGTPARHRYAIMIIAKVAKEVGLTNAQTQAALWAANHFRKNRVPGNYLSEIEKRQAELVEIFSDLKRIRGL